MKFPIAGLVALALVAGCSAAVEELGNLDFPRAVDREMILGSKPLRCLVGEAYTSADILVEPGNGNAPPLIAGPATLQIPRSAVATPTTFRMRVNRSNYLMVEIEAIGHESYQFLRPAELRLNMAQCGDANLEGIFLLHLGPNGPADDPLTFTGTGRVYRADIRSLSLFLVSWP